MRDYMMAMIKPHGYQNGRPVRICSHRNADMVNVWFLDTNKMMPAPLASLKRDPRRKVQL